MLTFGLFACQKNDVNLSSQNINRRIASLFLSHSHAGFEKRSNCNKIK